MATTAEETYGKKESKASSGSNEESKAGSSTIERVLGSAEGIIASMVFECLSSTERRALKSASRTLWNMVFRFEEKRRIGLDYLPSFEKGSLCPTTTIQEEPRYGHRYFVQEALIYFSLPQGEVVSVSNDSCLGDFRHLKIGYYSKNYMRKIEGGDPIAGERYRHKRNFPSNLGREEKDCYQFRFHLSWSILCHTFDHNNPHEMTDAFGLIKNYLVLNNKLIGLFRDSHSEFSGFVNMFSNLFTHPNDVTIRQFAYRWKTNDDHTILAGINKRGGFLVYRLRRAAQEFDYSKFSSRDGLRACRDPLEMTHFRREFTPQVEINSQQFYTSRYHFSESLGYLCLDGDQIYIFETHGHSSAMNNQNSGEILCHRFPAMHFHTKTPPTTKDFEFEQKDSEGSPSGFPFPEGKATHEVSLPINPMRLSSFPVSRLEPDCRGLIPLLVVEQGCRRMPLVLLFAKAEESQDLALIRSVKFGGNPPAGSFFSPLHYCVKQGFFMGEVLIFKIAFVPPEGINTAGATGVAIFDYRKGDCALEMFQEKEKIHLEVSKRRGLLFSFHNMKPCFWRVRPWEIYALEMHQLPGKALWRQTFQTGRNQFHPFLVEAGDCFFLGTSDMVVHKTHFHTSILCVLHQISFAREREKNQLLRLADLFSETRSD